MSFADRLRAWFKGESKRANPSPSTEKASRSSTRELSEFVDSRQGVEAFLEPKTALYSTTLLLIAADGEYFRRPVGDPKQAAAFCERKDIPLYDARKVGYPRRMRDYERGKPSRRISLDELPPWPGQEQGGDAAEGGGEPAGSRLAGGEQRPQGRSDKGPGQDTDDTAGQGGPGGGPTDEPRDDEPGPPPPPTSPEPADEPDGDDRRDDGPTGP